MGSVCLCDVLGALGLRPLRGVEFLGYRQQGFEGSEAASFGGGEGFKGLGSRVLGAYGCCGQLVV